MIGRNYEDLRGSYTQKRSWQQPAPNEVLNYYTNINYLFLSSSPNSFLSTPRMRHPTTAPINTAVKYPRGFPMVGRTKIPPWGALKVHPKNMEIPPANAAPIAQEWPLL